MSGNEITNAGFQDGVTGWLTSAGLNLSVDEEVFGYEGRAVLTGTKNVAVDEVVFAFSEAIPVQAGEIVEVFGHVNFTRGANKVALIFTPAGGGGDINPDVTRVKKSDKLPKLGLANTFDFYHQRVTAPVTGTVRFYAEGLANGAGVSTLVIMKPYLEVLPSSKTKYRCWDPGPSVNEDLELSIWPPELPHLLASSFSVENVPTRKGFQSDLGVVRTKKITDLPWYNVTAAVKVDQEGHAILDRFFRDAPEPFWFVRPDTLQLCRARWLPDGEPMYSGLSGDKTATFSLQVQVA